MRNIFTCIIMLTLTATSFCQQHNVLRPGTHEYYLKKSKSQKIIGFIILGTSVPLITYFSISKSGYPYSVTELVSVGAALLMPFASVPFFIAAGRNKHKAMATSAYLKLEHAPSFKKSGVNLLSFPSVAMNIHF